MTRNCAFLQMANSSLKTESVSTEKARNVTVGLALYWLCITDNSGLSTYGLNGLWKGDEPPILLLKYGPPLPLHLHCGGVVVDCVVWMLTTVSLV